MTRSERYKNLRMNLIGFLAENFLPPESSVEASYRATRMKEFADEMDSIAAESLKETVMEFSAIQRDTEIL